MNRREFVKRSSVSCAAVALLTVSQGGHVDDREEHLQEVLKRV